MRAAILFVWPEKQPVLFLTKIIGAVGIAQQRQLLVALGELGNALGDQILVRQRHAGHVAPEHGADLVRAIAGGVDHIFTADLALRRRQHPFAILAAHTGDRAEADDLGTHVAPALGQGLGQLRRVDIAVQRVPLAAIQGVCLEEGIDLLHLGRRHFLKLDAHLPAHALDMAELFHALAGMRQPDGPGDMIVHRIVDLRAKLAVQAGRIGLDLHHRP